MKKVAGKPGAGESYNEIIMAAGEQFCSEPLIGVALAELTVLVEFMEACNEGSL